MVNNIYKYVKYVGILPFIKLNNKVNPIKQIVKLKRCK